MSENASSIFAPDQPSFTSDNLNQSTSTEQALITHNSLLGGTSRPKYRISLYHLCNCVPGLAFATSKYNLSLRGESFRLNKFDFILGVFQFILYLIGRYESCPPSILRWLLDTDWRAWRHTLPLSNPIYPGAVPSVTLPVPSFPGESPLTCIQTPGFFSIHPFLNGEVPRPDFVLNLVSRQFAPMQIMQGHAMPLGPEILQQPAAHPPIYRLRIVSDDLPELPISLDFDPENYLEQTRAMVISPISLGDVLAQIHRTLHERISHIDWVNLDANKKGRITRAFEARCANVPTTRMAQLLRNDGVKKVDYLLGKTWFEGLIRTKNPEVLKLVVSGRLF